MAVAYDASTDGGYTNSGTTRTFSHTATGSNCVLIVGSWTRSSGANAVTGITFDIGGVPTPMVPLGTEIIPAHSSGDEYIRLWGLEIGTGAGTGKNIVISCPSGMESIVWASSYTGASLPDATSNQAETTSTDTVCSVTTVTDNSWAIVLYRDSGGAGSAGAGATFRTYGLSSGGTGCYDTNSAKTPAGSFSLTVSHGSAPNGYQMAAIPPYSAPSTQIKSRNGVLIANVKSANGVPNT